MTEPRRTSDQRFPHDWPGWICYLELCEGQLLWLKNRAETREAVTRALAGQSTLYAAWPGQYRTDLFLVDDLDKLAAEIGLKPTKTGR